MSFLREIDRYLTVRRRLGADLSTDERILRRFATFADRDDAQYVNTSLIMRCLESLPSASPGTRATRFRVARQFAEWPHGLDPTHEAPPRGLVPGRVRRTHPYFYREAEIVAIIEHARTLPSVYGMRGLTCSTLFGLIAVTGFRISEALGLDPADLDVDSGVLHVRQGKLGKERRLPLDQSVVQRLESYCRKRDRLLGRRPEAFFVTCEGHRLGDCGARYNFAHVCQQIGLRQPQLHLRHGRGPRIHDLRHSTAMELLHHGVDQSVIALWPGHESVETTQIYIHADMRLKEEALSQIASPETHPGRYRPSDDLLAFLEAL